MKEELKREIAAEAAKIIFANEGNYASVNADDNGAVSVGKVQWHGNRALSLLKKIAAHTLVMLYPLPTSNFFIVFSSLSFDKSIIYLRKYIFNRQDIQIYLRNFV